MACERLSGRMGRCFEVRKGLGQGCLISPWLFNIFLDRVVRKVNESVTGMGVQSRYENGGGWEIKLVVYGDDSAGSRNKSVSTAYFECVLRGSATVWS